MRYIITILILVLLGVGGYFLMQSGSFTISPDNGTGEQAYGPDGGQTDQNGTTTPDDDGEREPVETIGSSVEERDIQAYHFGDGDREILFVGGIHGGYEWNTILLAYEFIDHLEASPDFIPEGVTVTVIPVLNPDGLYETVGTAGRFTSADVPAQNETISGRFNANDVDLNRNFDCNWESTGTWQSRDVDGGSAPFSEPESAALRDYVQNNSIDAAVVWYSASGDVVPAGCGGEKPEQARTMVQAYADAAGYAARDSFDYYEITGDAADWLAKSGVPAISVVLDTHSSTEWSKNRQGIEAVLQEVSSRE